MGGFFGLSVDLAIDYVRVQAWLNSKPEQSHLTRRETYKESAESKIEPDDISTWLINYSLDCGWYEVDMNGLNVVSWREIRAWQKATNNQDSWLANTVKKISNEYVKEYNASKDKKRLSPVADIMDRDEQRKAVSSQFADFLKSEKTEKSITKRKSTYG